MTIGYLERSFVIYYHRQIAYTSEKQELLRILNKLSITLKEYFSIICLRYCCLRWCHASCYFNFTLTVLSFSFSPFFPSPKIYFLIFFQIYGHCLEILIYFYVKNTDTILNKTSAKSKGWSFCEAMWNYTWQWVHSCRGHI